METCKNLETQVIKDKFEEYLVSKIAGRNVLVWGAVKRNDFFLEFAGKNNIPIIGYIDSNASASSLNGYPIWTPDNINPETQYLFIGLNYIYSDILNQLNVWKKLPYEDYLYWSKNDLTLTQCNGFFNDFFGNQIVGNVTGFSVRLKRLSNLRIGQNCIIDRSVKIVLGENSILEIGDNCIFEKDVMIRAGNNSFVHIGKNCKIKSASRILCDNNGKTYIYDNVRFGMNFRLASNGGYIFIHQGCIFSTDIILQGSDGHPIYDLQHKCTITDPQKYKIEIGEHVWIGRRCNIRYGAKIGSGSVIGMGSFICKEIPNNVIAAGNPARIIRENIAWSRRECSNPEKYFEEYDFR